ncbi:MAG: hypothetical protein J7518_22465 [Nocardioidaceae bacterium]|nr:hypothetical protein [Nocardioidaceae bacterium]
MTTNLPNASIYPTRMCSLCAPHFGHHFGVASGGLTALWAYCPGVPVAPDPEASQAPRSTDSADRTSACNTSGSGLAMVYSAAELRALSPVELNVYINHLADVIADSLLVELPDGTSTGARYWLPLRCAAVNERVRRLAE